MANEAWLLSGAIDNPACDDEESSGLKKLDGFETSVAVIPLGKATSITILFPVGVIAKSSGCFKSTTIRVIGGLMLNNDNRNCRTGPLSTEMLRFRPSS